MKWLSRYLPQNIARHLGSFSGMVKDIGHGVMAGARFLTSDTGKRLGGSFVSSLGKLGVLNPSEVKAGRNLLKNIQGKASEVQRIGKTVEEFGSQFEQGNKNIAKPDSQNPMQLMPVKNRLNENNLMSNLDFQNK